MDINFTSLDIVLPVLDEERTIESSIRKLVTFSEHFLINYQWEIIVADNGSTDMTPEIVQKLSSQFENVSYFRLDQKGRGRALKTVWSSSDSDLMSYMDVDLSTDLNVLTELLESVKKLDCSIAVGSRLLKSSNVIGRSIKRGFISRCYSFLFRTMFLVSFKDAQCGFKVISREAADQLLPYVKDTGWFFDTELLIMAEKTNFKVKEFPVRWIDDPNSSVKIISTAWKDIKGLIRMRFGGLRFVKNQLTKFD
tara:strand:+ start:664 stop:1419 length:756 start_codon:yes stop_codon:yes gene_type:complete